MQISAHSKNHFLKTMSEWDVPREYADPIYNYFVYGFPPGGFFTSVLSNDFINAMAHSHPANSIQGLKALSGWIRSTCTAGICYGSYTTVKKWLDMEDHERRAVLENFKLIFPEKDEIVMILKDEPTVEPFFYA